jgi:uncharacterized phage protein (TIGR02220 family)
VDYFQIANHHFERVHHYKQRCPPWLKLYGDYLSDYHFCLLTDQEKYHFWALLLLASRNENKLPYDATWIQSQISGSELVNLEKLEALGFIEKIKDASNMLATCYQLASKVLAPVEKRRGEKSRYTMSGCAEDDQPSNPSESAIEKAQKLTNYFQEAREVLSFLNEKTQRNFRASPTNLKLIVTRLKSGATKAECKQVIANRFRKWSDDPKMVEYLRPKTLFNATNFENYRGELVIQNNEN